ncbi:MAG: hypothetical protein H0W46_04805 [Acidimicrobiia bacterium]|nr:hypothetical protein [Acidimicrobiia bacterium]
MTLVVSLTTGSKDPVTVNWATAGGPAGMGSDFTTASGQIVFGAWETVKTLTVVVNGDTTWEPNESFTIQLSGAVGASISDGTGVVTIVNDDSVPPTVTVAATDASGSEAGPGTITFTITRSGDLAPAITVGLGWSGTAASGDYSGAVATVSFAADQTTATVTITPVDDMAGEGSETVILTVLAGAGYLLGTPSSATAAIIDDAAPPPPPLPSLSVNDVSVTEGDKMAGPTATLTITLSAAATTNVTVTVSIVGGTATSGTDYTGGSTVTLTSTPGQTTRTFSITIRGDRTAELNETVIVALSAVSANATIADNQGIITIVNDDGAPLVVSAAGSASAGAAPLPAKRIDEVLGAATAWWAAAGYDVSALAGVAVHIEDMGDRYLGQAVGTVTIVLDDDAAGWGADWQSPADGCIRRARCSRSAPASCSRQLGERY